MGERRLRFLRLRLNLNRPADRRLSEAVDAHCRGAMTVSDLLREAIAVYLAGADSAGTVPPRVLAPVGPAQERTARPEEEGEIDVFGMAIHRPAVDTDDTQSGDRR